MKDNFSSQSDQYARFRPVYPRSLFDYLITLVPDLETAWDCGTGNGQVARELAFYFDQVYATDLSQQQIDEAIPHEKIFYSVSQAESAPFPDNTFDLITVAQAIHWFDFEAFYREVNRTIKDGGILAVIGYGLFRVSPEIDAVIDEFYKNVIGPHWDTERKYIDEHYQTIPFPFGEIKAEPFEMVFEWSFEHLTGYLQTWSAVKHYRKATGNNPLDLVFDQLKVLWGTDTRVIRFPLLLRIGKIEK